MDASCGEGWGEKEGLLEIVVGSGHHGLTQGLASSSHILSLYQVVVMNERERAPCHEGGVEGFVKGAVVVVVLVVGLFTVDINLLYTLYTL